MAIEFNLSGQRYRAEKLNAFEQWDVTRRLLPVVSGAADVFVRFFRNQSEVKGTLSEVLDLKIADIIEPLSKALSMMSDIDSRFVINACLSKVSREQSGGWAPILSPNGGLMFIDIEMPTMIQLVWRVIEFNLLSFSAALPGTSSSPGRA